ncbi:Lysozyme [Aphelenchoides fujianensis]|nr:Lysozyme [Aphelenchoides fujianensis]
MFEELRLFAFAGLLLINSDAVNGDCLLAICDEESNCRPIGCGMDYSCGYFQIQSDYYTDCGTPNFDGDFERSWKNCADDYACASECVQAYFNRYNRMCSNVADECEKMARLHNGGPNGCQNPATVAYWNRIKLAYYKDCGKPDFDGDLERSWKKCADDFECASRCVQKYYNRYRHKCSEVDDECEKMARLHNGGPAGCQKSATFPYWERVKSRLGSERILSTSGVSFGLLTCLC